MAIARPRLVTQISGTLGSVEFAQHKSLVIIRKRKKPQTLITSRTIEAQRLHAVKIAVWQNMKISFPYHITNWHTYALNHPITNRLGQPRTLSGFQWYMKLFAPTQAGSNGSRFRPCIEPRVQPPTDFWATIHAPGYISTLILNANFNEPYMSSIIKIVYYSDPIPPSGNMHRVRHHHLCNIRNVVNTIQDDFTVLCTQREITFREYDQIIITIIGIYDWHLRSLPASITVTVQHGYP